jgi:N-acetyl-gamma-glutamylphosphate reductase
MNPADWGGDKGYVGNQMLNLLIQHPDQRDPVHH